MQKLSQNQDSQCTALAQCNKMDKGGYLAESAF